MTPTSHMSISYVYPAPCRISGALQLGVPVGVYILCLKYCVMCWTLCDFTNDLLIPKSIILICVKSSEIKIFSGFRSRWHTPLCSMQQTALSSFSTIYEESVSLRVLFLSLNKLSSDLKGMYSMTKWTVQLFSL